jgi:hypothetical protein
MKNVTRLVVAILVICFITTCNYKTPEEPEAIDGSKLAQLEKKPIKEYWFSDYLPLIPNLYGIRTLKRTIGTPGTLVSKIIGTETVQYQTGDLVGTIIRLAGGQEAFYVENKYLYWVKIDGKAILSTDCEKYAYPSGCIIGKVNDGMTVQLIAPFNIIFNK